MQAKAAGGGTLDVAIGARLRARRRELGLSQTDLARRLGVSFQQVQKYESGANRVAASTLAAAARALETTPAWLLGEETASSPEETRLVQALARPGALELLEAFDAIDDLRTRSALVALVREIAAESG